MEWILCDERLPEEGQMVLTTIRGHDVIIPQEGETIDEAIDRIWNDVCYVSIGFIGSDGWYGADGFPEVVHPIAWMPLPKPYKADRKTEPSNSEKPNNCDTCKHWEYDAKYKWWHCPLQDNGMYECHYEPKDEPKTQTKTQNSNLTFEKADEPQIDCYMCKWLGDVDVCGRCRNRNLFAEADTEPKPKDEPQTDCAWK